jgi:hypothetical protein
LNILVLNYTMHQLPVTIFAPAHDPLLANDAMPEAEYFTTMAANYIVFVFVNWSPLLADAPISR